MSAVQTLKDNKVALVRLVLFLGLLGVMGVDIYQYVEVKQEMKALNGKVKELNVKVTEPTATPSPVMVSPSPKLKVR